VHVHIRDVPKFVDVRMVVNISTVDL